MEVLRVEHLCKVYGRGEAKVDALKDVSFTMEKGEFTAVVGESGSGKSTLLHCIGGLEEPSSGHVYLDGRDLFAMKESQRTVFRRQNIGFIFQSYNLMTSHTALEKCGNAADVPGRTQKQSGKRLLHRCCGKWDWKSGCITGPIRCRVVSSSEWELPGRLWQVPRSSLRTNLPATWIPKPPLR